MTGHVQHVVDTAGDAEVATVCAAHGAVTGQVVALELLGEVALLEALRVAPDGADHRRPRLLDHQDTARAVGHVVTGLVDDGGGDARQRQRTGARHQRRRARQRGDHVATGLGLPEGVHDRAALATDVLVVPHPGFGVDRLTHRAHDAQRGQIPVLRVHLLVAVRSLDERTDRRRSRVEDGALVLLDHLPEAAGVRVGRHTFEDDLRGAGGQRAVGHIAVAGDPADVGRAPEHIVVLQVEGPVHGQVGPQQVAARAVLHALGLAGGAGGVEHEERVLGAHHFGGAVGGLVRHHLVHEAVAAGDHVHRCRGALEDDHVLDGLTAAHGDAFVHDGFQRQLLAAAQLVVGGDHGHGAGVLDTFLQGLGREAAEHHAVGGADAGAGLHGDHAFDGHGHVDDHTVTLLDAARLQGVRELRHLGQQFLVGDLGDFAAIGFENDRGLVLDRRAHVAVQAVVGSVELTVLEPLVEGLVGIVEHLGERLVPGQGLAGALGPETFEVLLGFGTQRVVGVHAGNAGGLDGGFAGFEHAVFDQSGLDGRRRCGHDLSPGLR